MADTLVLGTSAFGHEGSTPSPATKVMDNSVYTPDQERRALEIAVRAHALQTDKGGRNYIEHPLAVAAWVAAAGPKYRIVAFLHDTVEDTSVTLPELRQEFGDEIADAVLSVTRLSPAYAHRLGFAVPSKELYRDFVERSKQNAIGRVVKMGDLVHNMNPQRMSVLQPEEQGIIKRYRWALREICTHTFPGGSNAWINSPIPYCSICGA